MFVYLKDKKTESQDEGKTEKSSSDKTDTNETVSDQQKSKPDQQEELKKEEVKEEVKETEKEKEKETGSDEVLLSFFFFLSSLHAFGCGGEVFFLFLETRNSL